jgi:hypothetical protein
LKLGRAEGVVAIGGMDEGCVDVACLFMTNSWWGIRVGSGIGLFEED